MATSSTATIVLGKRKARQEDDRFSIRLESSPPTFPIESECESDASYKQASTSTIHLSSLRRERRFKCPHENCTKAYTKPSRLAEHERSHTGDVGRRNDYSTFVDGHPSDHSPVQHAARTTLGKHIYKRILALIFLRQLDRLLAKTRHAKSVSGPFSTCVCIVSYTKGRNHSRCVFAELNYTVIILNQMSPVCRAIMRGFVLEASSTTRTHMLCTCTSRNEAVPLRTPWL